MTLSQQWEVGQAFFVRGAPIETQTWDGGRVVHISRLWVDV